MNRKIFLLMIVVPAFFAGCSSQKTTDVKTSNGSIPFYDTTWELEYISGPRIAFEGLYPETKPYITFTEAENKFGGNNSCNVYSGAFTLKGNTIHFGDAITTMRWCEGDGEKAFMNMLGKVNKYAIDSYGKLLLLTDDIPMLRFKKIAKTQH
ncbi:META domain-containing protein [Flavobacterium wongokense]|uniref:META domain-containing protein n=1 Tax=Flavobacterium wongokense TaxID=2910674 RepID=UPI001F43D002|nr:META domain-containing protein [Flavobacterium sp. WG47]MCF6131900.1 META domain-containing protein [Flavobacterium sp. WG47]